MRILLQLLQTLFNLSTLLQQSIGINQGTVFFHGKQHRHYRHFNFFKYGFQ